MLCLCLIDWLLYEMFVHEVMPDSYSIIDLVVNNEY